MSDVPAGEIRPKSLETSLGARKNGVRDGYIIDTTLLPTHKAPSPASLLIFLLILLFFLLWFQLTPVSPSVS